MKICFVYKNLSLGGVQSKLASLSNQFSSLGHNVEVCLFNGEPPKFDLAENVTINFLDGGGRIGKIIRFMQFLRRLNADVLIVPTPHFASLTVVLCSILFVNIPIIIMEESDTREEYYNAKGIHKLPFLIIGNIYRRASGVIAVSEGVKNSLSDFSGLNIDRISVIYNPIYRDDIDELGLALVEHPWFSDGGEIVFVAAGRLVPQKNFNLLLRSFHEVSKGHPEARLIILGEGPQLADLRLMADELGIAGIVDFPGLVSNPYKWFSRSNFFVLSSSWEGFGNVLVEAMACGCTAISTNCPSGPSEILESGKFGYLAQSGNIDSLADAMRAALLNPLDSNISKNRARYFSVARSASDYIELLEGILKRSNVDAS